MVTGTTKSGFNFSIDENRLDDMEFIDALAEADENAIALTKVVRTLLGDSQKRELYAHVRTEDGRVPVGAIVEEVTEMMMASAELKNC